jgi:hypothetical protein
MNDHEDLFRAVQFALAGHSEAAVMRVLLKSLVVVIGVSAPSVARAEALIDALPGELKPILRTEWLNYRAHRAQAEKRDQTN